LIYEVALVADKILEFSVNHAKHAKMGEVVQNVDVKKPVTFEIKCRGKVASQNGDFGCYF
jgi:hypothetical protein